MIKRMNPKAVFQIVCQYDDALDFTPDAPAETDLETPKTLSGAESDPRWLKYLENFDLSVLKFKDGATPTLFHVRQLKNDEVAEINEKYLTANTVTKVVAFGNRSKMLIEMFNMAVLGVTEGGELQKISSDDVPFATALSVGSLISILTNTDKPLKNG